MSARKFSFGHVDSFSAVELSKDDAKSNYAIFRAAALKAGRFSTFEASENQRVAGLYTMLCRDPEIETDQSCGYPWTRVRLQGSQS